MSGEFDGLYARVGRPSIPPERLLRAQLLQICYSIRSERLLMEQDEPDNSRELVDATRPFQVRASISIKDRWRACGSAADFVIESISKGAL
jgi:Transposase domain (DUF772)